jgi:hypothetical protein
VIDTDATGAEDRRGCVHCAVVAGSRLSVPVSDEDAEVGAELESAVAVEPPTRPAPPSTSTRDLFLLVVSAAEGAATRWPRRLAERML